MDINVCIVTHGRPAMARQIDKHRVIIQPPLSNDRYGVFHPKLMLLFHQDSLRVIIGSANMVYYDYEDMENVVFIQDFPQLDKPLQSSSSLPQFALDIYDLLEQMQVPESVKDELLLYDYSKAKAHIVASVSGVFIGENEYNRYGHTRLADIVHKIVGNLDSAHYPKVEMQTSSLGGLTVPYMKQLYRSFCGMPAYTPYSKATDIVAKDQVPPISIIYPTVDTIDSSRFGRAGASTICFNRKSWQSPQFPKEVMHDAISHRPGTLMHSKVYHGIVYRSHNSTASAWGRFTMDKKTKQPKMNISNWELGVVFPLTDESDIPAPYLRPPPRYNPGQMPWTQIMEW
ncbi:tyrosyl-DNA phosphodiesterase I [Pilobolus umbonatus]|nr:tyrosyl-DNA phosphodiesterase I [Pilobolus umbonatus]